MCLVSFISLVVFAYKMFCYQQVVIEIDAYYFALKQGEAPPPDFIIKNYEKLEVRKIILNWIAFSVYILGLLTLGLLL